MIKTDMGRRGPSIGQQLSSPIDVREGKGVAYSQEIGRVVYKALVGAGVPKDDRFQLDDSQNQCRAQTLKQQGPFRFLTSWRVPLVNQERRGK
jgi:hypothetical protein